MASKLVKELTNENFMAVTDKGVSLVDFWAPWCGPCRMIAPVIDELSNDFEMRANICKVNTDDNQDIIKKYNVKSIPTILIMKDGEVIETIVGAQAKDKLTEAINKAL